MSDTHDHIENIRKAVEIFREREVELVIHAGDYTSPPARKVLAGLITAGVLGQYDGETLGIAKVFEKNGGLFKGDFLKLDIEGRTIAVYHGTIPEIREALGRCGFYDAVISGHTHKIENYLEGETRMLNPGSAHGFDKEASIMIFDTFSNEVEVIKFSYPD